MKTLKRVGMACLLAALTSGRLGQGSNQDAGDSLIFGSGGLSTGGGTDCESTTTASSVTLSSAVTELSTAYTPAASATINTIALMLDKTSTPAGTIQIDVFNDNGGEPGATKLGTTATQFAGNLTGTPAYMTFTLTSALTLKAGVTYQFVLSETGITGGGTARWYAVAASDCAGTSVTAIKQFANGSWSTASGSNVATLKIQ